MIVKFFATYRQITGCASCEMPAQEDVLALLHALAEKWPEFRGMLLNEDGTDKGDYVSIAVSGRYAENLAGVLTKLTDQDEIAITPVVAGG